uniref:GLOBIN domain-containing protein n=1 Tax=Parastrongyloides trichosuri TaxID=131310 RepID=A0A0N4ZJ71_PARTI
MYELSTSSNNNTSGKGYQEKENSNDNILGSSNKSNNNLNKETNKLKSISNDSINNSKRQVCRSQTVRIKLDNSISDVDTNGDKNSFKRPISQSSSKTMSLHHTTSAINFLSNFRNDGSSSNKNTGNQSQQGNSSIKRKGSTKFKDSIKDKNDNVSNLVNKKNSKKDSHPVSISGREIIISCFDNPHGDLGQRVIGRLYEKRIDYQKFIFSFGKHNMRLLGEQLKTLMENVVANLDNLATIENLSKAYGETHVDLKMFGFKPDFWVGLADSLTVECVILDQATHSPTDVVAAWSQLIATIFSNIRDGYYGALRLHRIASRKNMLAKKSSSNDFNNIIATTSSSTNQNSVDIDYQSNSTATTSLIGSRNISVQEISNITNDDNKNRNSNFINFSRTKSMDLSRNVNLSNDSSFHNDLSSASIKPALTKCQD